VHTESLPELLARHAPERIGILAFQHLHNSIPAQNQFVLSGSGSVTKAAQRLFAGLRYLDSLSVDVIYAELLPEKELGRAVNDRIRRAAAR
jgi:L-threonylcarbamoyladenylate synthase